MLLWRAAFGGVALGRAVWRAAFGHVGSAYRRTMILGVCAVVKGGFWGICRRTQEGGIPAYAGMTGGGGGMGRRTQTASFPHPCPSPISDVIPATRPRHSREGGNPAILPTHTHRNTPTATNQGESSESVLSPALRATMEYGQSAGRLAIFRMGCTTPRCP